MQFQIGSRRENRWGDESSRLEFLEKFSANNFALSDAEDNTSGPLNRGGITDPQDTQHSNLTEAIWA